MSSLYEFMKEKTWNLTECWYASLDKTKDGIYGTSDSEKIELLKKQNHQFHLLFCEIFNENSEDLEERFDQWLDQMAADQGHLATPIPQIIDEFLTVQEQYLDLVSEYSYKNRETTSFTQNQEWNRMVSKSFRKIITEFGERNLAQAQHVMQAQQEMITELSSPVIPLNSNVALLPLIGEIDTHRAKVIFEQTLDQCVSIQVEALLIDLSGVPVVDTMVANQLFSLVEGLKLVGTKASLSGLRPEIAQTSIQLGIDFSSVNIYSTISRALEKMNA
ncbi:STAS domain-containing protein [Bacillus sp. JCM 19041]|uniref:STAS domain-containing protein n=1 Tax=Bacillus sp. JCM 19041 TaxID=1460637 RepID=UPI0006D2ABC5